AAIGSTQRSVRRANDACSQPRSYSCCCPAECCLSDRRRAQEKTKLSGPRNNRRQREHHLGKTREGCTIWRIRALRLKTDPRPSLNQDPSHGQSGQKQKGDQVSNSEPPLCPQAGESNRASRNACGAHEKQNPQHQRVVRCHTGSEPDRKLI